MLEKANVLNSANFHVQGFPVHVLSIIGNKSITAAFLRTMNPKRGICFGLKKRDIKGLIGKDVLSLGRAFTTRQRGLESSARLGEMIRAVGGKVVFVDHIESGIQTH